MSNDNELTEFERRTRAVLRESVDNLNAATLSRLTQARHAALDQRTRRKSWLDFRHLAPAGAVAAVALVAVLFVGQHGKLPHVNESGGGALYDMELLADADAYELTQESDQDFVEWAAAMGESGPEGI
jgi:hypothetical protein